MPAPGVSAVLFSGGLDSAVLLVEEADRYEVQPIYVSAGLAWESAERQICTQFLASAATPFRVHPLVSLALDMTDVYAGGHWAIAGRPPAYHTPDEHVYLPGRNVVLLAKAGVFCASTGIPRLVIGTLAGNPFPDATAEFREAMARALSLGLQHSLIVAAPYESLHKEELVRRAVHRGLPLEHTLSCMNPEWSANVPAHCGRCSKCRERHEAFLAAGMHDSTSYADRRHVAG